MGLGPQYDEPELVLLAETLFPLPCPPAANKNVPIIFIYFINVFQ